MKAKVPLQNWLWPAGLVFGISAVLFLALYLLDYSMADRALDQGPLGALFTYEPETVENALGNLAQVVVAVLGIVITVVSIVVQLAANRYTPRIADLFFRDRTNLALLGFFVMTCIFSIWVSLAVGRRFVPQRSISAILLLVTASLLLMIPYFAYVFNFLDPERIVGRMKNQALRSALHDGADVEARQAAVLANLEQLCDVAVNAVGNKDKLIAGGAVDALKDLGVSYVLGKDRNPAAWFVISPALLPNPDFVPMAGDSIAALSRERAWLEWKLLRQYQTIYNEALVALPDINHLIAINARYLGEAALQRGDLEVVRLIVKFYNTFLRVTLNARSVRTAYNLLHQYRQLAEGILHGGHPGLATDIADYLRYYAQVAHTMDLGFVTETIAYDLATLCEVAFDRASPAHERLLASLLLVDQGAEDEGQERTLRGVRKAQIKLATGYLVRGHEPSARAIFRDMEHERPERLRSLRDELLRIESKDFWEIIDRGVNFDYLDPPRKQQLAVFFAWFQERN